MSEDNEPLLTPLQRAYLERNPGASLVETAEPDGTDRKREPVGVGGWLAFFGITLIALGPLITIATTAAEFASLESQYPSAVGSSQWNAAVAAGWSAAVVYCTISIFAGWRIFNRLVPTTIPIVIACIWLMGPALAIVSLMVVQYVSGGSITNADAGSALGRPLVYCTIWTIYLLQSRRVKNTYRGQREGAAWLERLNRSARQFIFFSACWIVLSFSYFTFVSLPDPYANDASNSWVIILLPPLLVGAGIWVYRKFVGSASK